jgi:hypothetical protein
MPARLQFSIRSCLAATAGIAVVWAVLNAPYGTWYAGLSLIPLTVAIPSILILSVLNLSGYPRAFCVGALVPACAALSNLANVLPWVIDHAGDPWTIEGIRECFADMSAQRFQFSYGIFWFSMPFCGLLGIGVERAFKK